MRSARVSKKFHVLFESIMTLRHVSVEKKSIILATRLNGSFLTIVQLAKARLLRGGQEASKVAITI